VDARAYAPISLEEIEQIIRLGPRDIPGHGRGKGREGDKEGKDE